MSDIKVLDPPAAQATGAQLIDNGDTIAQIAQGLKARTKQAFPVDPEEPGVVMDEALQGYWAELSQYCAALAEVGATCAALGHAAKQIVRGNVEADQTAAAIIRSRSSYA